VGQVTALLLLGTATNVTVSEYLKGCLAAILEYLSAKAKLCHPRLAQKK